MPNSRPTVLFIVHSWGGGTIRFANDLADLISDRVNVVWAWGVENKSIYISTLAPYSAQKSFSLRAGLDAPVRALMELNPNRVNIIHTIGLQQHINSLIEKLGIPYDVTFTDYHHFSVTPHFEDNSGRFVGDAAVAMTMQAARDNPQPLLSNAERRIAVSQDLAHRISQSMPESPVIPVRVSEPGTATNVPPRIVPLGDGEVMRVLVLGRPHPAKGLSTIVEVAHRIKRENFPIEIISLGEINRKVSDILNPLSHVQVHGAYAQEDLTKIVARLNPHLAWFPFNIPETHSYALSDAMSLGLPVLASGIGAVAERVIGRPLTWIVPFEDADADNFFEWLKKLYRDRLQTPALWPSIDHLPPVAELFYPDAYLKPLF